MTAKLPLVTPGEILAEEFLKPLGITEYRLAKDINVPARRINEIVHGKRAISTDTAYRLRNTLVPRPSSGSTLRFSMTWTFSGGKAGSRIFPAINRRLKFQKRRAMAFC